MSNKKVQQALPTCLVLGENPGLGNVQRPKLKVPLARRLPPSPAMSLGMLLPTETCIWLLVIITNPSAFTAGWAIPGLCQLSRPENIILTRLESRAALVRTHNTVKHFQKSPL